MEKNPIVQSMLPKGLPKMAGPEKRKGPSSVSMRSAITDSMNAGPTLRAADYTPPASFVETMERPSPYSKPKNSVTFSGENKTVSLNVLDELWK